MNRRTPDEPELDFHDLIADPMIQLVMQADGIDERELRELFDRTAIEMRDRRSAEAGSSSAANGAPEGLRRGVGIMLVNALGHVFVGQRSDVLSEAWQMPQGGIEPGETPRAAALRELREEVGTANVEVIIGTDGWLSYELPTELLERIPNTRWKGQTQRWFLMRFLGEDGEINVATEHPEFSDWRWVPTDRLLGLIVPFKRNLYGSVLHVFAPHLSKMTMPRD
jgi:putative (di)nucleoside polyphosphate hydrolase